MAIHIVTDSTSDMPLKLMQETGVTVVPLNIHFGNEIYKDGVDIWSEEFYHRLKNEALLPNTSQPSPGEFLEVYQKIAQPGDTILSIHISAEMSGTVGAAKIAAEMLGPEYRVHVIDSRTVSMCLGLLVRKVVNELNAGAGVEFILANIQKWRQEIDVYFTVNSLEFLHRTGRIGKATVLLGSLLNIKPLLSIQDGFIVPVDKIRGNYQKVAQQMVDRLCERYGDRRVTISVLHTELPDLASVLKKLTFEKLNVGTSFYSLIGPVVGAHAGPHLIGIVVMPEE